MRFDSAEFETAFGTLSQLPNSSFPEIAFSGRSNVGKSSLLNKLIGRKSLARVSSMPGKTITINFYRLDKARFVDLPGYGYAKVSKSEKKRWSEMTEGYFGSERNIKLVVQLIDMRHSPSKDDLDMINYLYQMKYPFVIVLTKSDKLNKAEREKQISSINDELSFLKNVKIIPFSSVSGEGIAEIRAEIKASIV